MDRAGAKKNTGTRLPREDSLRRPNLLPIDFINMHGGEIERGSDQDEDKGNEEAEANFNYCLVAIDIKPTMSARHASNGLSRQSDLTSEPELRDA